MKLSLTGSVETLRIFPSLGWKAGMNFFLFLALFSNLASTARLPDLEEAVQCYWDYLLQRQKSRALEFVLPESRDHFLSRREPFFRSWRLLQLEAKSNRDYVVTTSVERLMLGSYYNWKVREHWFLRDGRWRVQINDSVAERRRHWQRSTPIRPRQGVLDVLPASLRIHFLSRRPEAALIIRNGLDEEVEVVEVNYDATSFDLVRRPRVVASGRSGKITLRYQGRETKKNLTGRVDLLLRWGSKEKSFSIPVQYNYLSPGARALLGLTREEADRLAPADRLTPRMTPPGEEETKSPPGSSPQDWGHPPLDRPDKENR